MQVHFISRDKQVWGPDASEATFFPYKDSVQFVKQLVRIREGKVLGGVCGGIGKYFDVDPVIVRILWVVLTCVSVGIGVIVYIAAWILMPEENDGTIIDEPAS